MTNSSFAIDAILGVGIIGCGLIGQKRAKALNSLPKEYKLIATFDKDPARATNLAKTYKALAAPSIDNLIANPDIQVVVIATLHDSLAEITLKAIKAGKHVLVEKPGARNVEELAPVIDAVSKSNLKVHVGFNHRYHRSLRKAKTIVNAGELGDLMFIRARYGHGARLGYDKEWRSDPLLSGGGELIDQGPHLIDLSRWFLGEFKEVQGFAHTYYWNMPVDDNGFMILKTADQQVAFLHASCTEWKNLFSMEIYGKLGKLDLSGLGGSYGVEKLTHYKMLPEMGPPETVSWEYPMGDDSWEIEMAEFYEDIIRNRSPSAGLLDAKAALEVVQTIYKESGYDHSA
jgi:predicted dehydrogenase